MNFCITKLSSIFPETNISRRELRLTLPEMWIMAYIHIKELRVNLVLLKHSFIICLCNLTFYFLSLFGTRTEVILTINYRYIHQVALTAENNLSL